MRYVMLCANTSVQQQRGGCVSADYVQAVLNTILPATNTNQYSIISLFSLHRRKGESDCKMLPRFKFYVKEENPWAQFNYFIHYMIL